MLLARTFWLRWHKIATTSLLADPQYFRESAALPALAGDLHAARLSHDKAHQEQGCCLVPHFCSHGCHWHDAIFRSGTENDHRMIVTCSAQQRGLRCWKSWQILNPPSLALPRNPAKYEVSTVSTAPPNAVHSRSLVQAKGKEKESKEFCLVQTSNGDVRFNFFASEDLCF